jgi:hypothetical protein
MCVEEALAMSDGPGPEDQESEELDGMPDPEAVAHRADGRPPEEESSDDPMAQAQTVLEDSEERTAEGAAGSEPTSETRSTHEDRVDARRRRMCR